MSSSISTNRRERPLAAAIVTAVAAFGLAPTAVTACPVCFGSSDPEVLHAFYLSAAMLTILPFLIVGLMIGGFAYLRRQQGKNQPE